MQRYSIGVFGLFRADFNINHYFYRPWICPYVSLSQFFFRPNHLGITPSDILGERGQGLPWAWFTMGKLSLGSAHEAGTL